MTSNAIRQLLDRMGPALGPRLSGNEGGYAQLAAHGPLGSELANLLLERNGCYSTTRSLLIRPLQRDETPQGVTEWNSEGGWRSEFEADLSGALFFAEDLFGEQFALRPGGVFRFHPETADWSRCAPTIEAWAQALLHESDGTDLGSPLAEAWQAKYGPIPEGTRLRPPIPFIFKESAGATLDDYRPIPEDEVMGFLATIANALKDVPEGDQVRLHTGKKPAGTRPQQGPRRRWWWPFGTSS